MAIEETRLSSEKPILSELDALLETVRVVFGFRGREEVQELFTRKLVRKAIQNLEAALESVRARRQPDEFALSLAVEMEILKEARAAGHDLESLFNDPDHREPPSGEITKLMERLWPREPERE
jgi:hypothetical protein